jgi:hypothetical protein
VGQVITAGHDGFAATSAATGRRLEWTSRITGVASTFAASGPLIYLGGDLRNSFGAVSGRPRNNLAGYDVVTGRFTTVG